MRLLYSVTSLVLLSICLSFHSCTEKDNEAPIVSILAPLSESVYSVFDTVTVRVSVVDETELVSVSAKLVNADFIPVGVSKNIAINTDTNQGFTELVINDKVLDTGFYYVLVIANDGTNEQREYQRITIFGLPKERKAIYFSSTNGLGADNISRVDSLFQYSSIWLQSNQDIGKICVNSLKDRLTLMGRFSTGINSYNLSFGSLVWSDDVFLSAQTARYTDLICAANDVYTSTYDREIRAYSVSGALQMNLQTGNYRPETLFAEENYLLVEMELIGDDDHFVFVYNRETKSLLWQLDVPMDIISICHLQGDEVLLFGVEDGSAKVLHYDIGSNAFWQPRLLPVGKLFSAVKMEGQMFAIAHENGLYTYTYSPNYLNLIKGGTIYGNIVFDIDNGVIVGANQNVLEEITPTGQLLNTVVHSDSITSIDIHYTR